jgi:hypothetical protein
LEKVLNPSSQTITISGDKTWSITGCCAGGRTFFGGRRVFSEWRMKNIQHPTSNNQHPINGQKKSSNVG